MQIRRMEGKERFDAALISAYCFHFRVEDVQAEKEKWEEREKKTAHKYEDWGAFDSDGTLMAHIMNHSFEFYLDGQVIRTGGIGGVSTLPQYRDRGAVRKIFAQILPGAYRSGEVLSTLYPFKHAFYRKQGYEVVTYQNEYTLKPGYLSHYPFDGEVHQWKNGDPVTEFLEVYRKFAPTCNLSMLRGEEEMLEHLKVEHPLMDRKFSYILRKDGNPVAYIIFTDIKNDPAAILKVEELAWTCREGFLGLLSFLGRFEADYGSIRLRLPAGIDLLRIIQTDQAYQIKKETGQSFMVRVVNAKRLLEIIRKPADCDFTVKITDPIIPENNQILRVKNEWVEVISGQSPSLSAAGAPDLEVSVQALGQLAVGCINLDEAMLRTDVRVNAKEEMLRRCFVEKKIFVTEQF